MKAMVVATVQGKRGVTPYDQGAYEKFIRKFRGLKPGQFMRIEYAIPRNPKHHKKLFALIDLIRNNSEIYDTKEKVLVGLKLATGHFDLVMNPLTDTVTPVPSSINFESMDQSPFDVWYEQAVTAAVQVLCPQIEDEEQAYRLMDRIVEGWG